MSAALGILIGHRYCQLGPGAAICSDARGNPTSCTWKPRRGKNVDGLSWQHQRHVADLIDAAYEPDLLLHAQLLNVRDHVLDGLELDRVLRETASEFARGRRQVLHELAQVLELVPR